MRAQYLGPIATAALVAMICYDATASTNNELLRAVRDVRAATVAIAKAGDGELLIERRETMRGKVNDSPRHRAELRFSGEDSLLLEYDPAGKQLRASWLWTGQAAALYFGPGSAAPTQVFLRKRELVGSPLDFQGVSFAHWARIPGPTSESEFFESGTRSDGLKVERTGDLVRVTYAAVIPPEMREVVSCEYSFDFDMLRGGMIVHYRSLWQGHHGGSKELDTLAEECSWAWSRVDGQIVPSKVERDISATELGAIVHKAHLVAEFSRFRSKAAEGAKLTMDDMGIPPGTEVFDSIANVSWKYFQGAGRANVAPVTRPTNVQGQP